MSGVVERRDDIPGEMTRELWEREPSRPVPVIGEQEMVENADTAVGNLLAKYGSRINLVCLPKRGTASEEPSGRDAEELKDFTFYSVDGSGAPRGGRTQGPKPNYGVGRGGVADAIHPPGQSDPPKTAGHVSGWDNSRL